MLCKIKLFQITAAYVSRKPTSWKLIEVFLSSFQSIYSFGITNLAYRSLQDQNENQCICLLGENGSGKTESARIALHFLSNVHLQQSLTNRKLFSRQNTSKLMRCKSLASYPRYDSAETPCHSDKQSSIEYARKTNVSDRSKCYIIETKHLLKHIFFLEIARNSRIRSSTPI